MYCLCTIHHCLCTVHVPSTIVYVPSTIVYILIFDVLFVLRLMASATCCMRSTVWKVKKRVKTERYMIALIYSQLSLTQNRLKRKPGFALIILLDSTA